MLNNIFELISHILFVISLAYYLITNLQWYNYKLKRVIFKHKKIHWHIIYFLLPIFAYMIFAINNHLFYFWIIFYLIYLPLLYLWQKKLDKPLKFTPKVKRLFFAVLLFTTILDTLCIISIRCEHFSTFIPLILAFLSSYLYDKIEMRGFINSAKDRLKENPDLKIVAITASYGKTSIKNFLYHILSKRFRVYKTPRSVNTLTGLIKDINENLDSSYDFYIAEAGARERGDIDEIARFLNHDYAIVGSIGPAHIEYFKTLENIRDTKMEILNSKDLKRAFIHKSANVKADSRVKIYGDEISNIKSTLDGIEFDLKIDDKIYHFKAPLLGKFNAINLSAAILLSKEIGMKIEDIQKALLSIPQVEHRLQKIEAGGKLIIDDSFNGNFEGMSASYKLVKEYQGRKVIITPGIVESDKETNEKLAKLIDEVFDLVIITGSLNLEILDKSIKRAKKIILKDKSNLETLLAKETKSGDLILFSNDAPTFI